MFRSVNNLGTLERLDDVILLKHKSNHDGESVEQLSSLGIERFTFGRFWMKRGVGAMERNIKCMTGTVSYAGAGAGRKIGQFPDLTSFGAVA